MATMETEKFARDAGDLCQICEQIVTWTDHLPPLKAGHPVRCFVNVRSIRPAPPQHLLKAGERIVDWTVCYSAEWL